MLRAALWIQTLQPHSFAPLIWRDSLLDFDGSASFRELLPYILGFFLVDAFLDRLGSTVNQVLGLFQAEAGDFSHSLDYVDLVSANCGENDGEIQLLFRRS